MLSKTKFLDIIGSNIKRIRKDKGITQDELADMCGFYRTYIKFINDCF